LPDIVALNFGVTVVHRDDLIRNSNIIGHNPQFIEIDEVEGIDIDTPLDFFIAEQLYRELVLNGKSLLE
jgi:N-acylneuraminate cytidylyltransferase